MPSTPILAGPRVVLRAVRPSDVEDRLRCGRDPEIEHMFGVSVEEHGPLTEEGASAWFQRLAGDPNPYHWVIEYGGRFIGTARLHSLDPHGRRARYAVGILNRMLLGQGLGTEATQVVLDFAFETLRLHRVDLRVLAYNERAIASYRKCGFVEEGRERESTLVDGSWHDDVMMSVLDHEYRASSSRRVVDPNQ
jgi:RimJ/RimL family protein N-acetyltransferase